MTLKTIDITPNTRDITPKTRTGRISLYGLLAIIILLLMTIGCSSGTFDQDHKPTKPSDETGTGGGSGGGTGKDEDNDGDNDGDKAEELTLLFTNDFHSQIQPIDEAAAYNAGKGGIERIKVLVDSVRQSDKTVLLCDAGDFVQGSYYFTCFNGEVEMMAQNEIGYDVKTIGNHEFDKKMVGLNYMFNLNTVPIVSSNYDFSGTALENRVKESVIIEKDGRKIGFIGLNTRLAGLVDPKGYEGVVYTAPIERAEALATELKEHGAEIVIALSHLGYHRTSDAPYYDRGIAMFTRNIDLIIGGHSHTFLTKADYVANLDGVPVPIVQTGCKGIYLGCIKLKLNGKGASSKNDVGKIVIPSESTRSAESLNISSPTGTSSTASFTDFSYRLIPVNKRLDSRIDPNFSQKIDYFSALLGETMDQVIAQCPVTMRKGSPQGLLSNFTADALVEICDDTFGVRPDLALYNNGGIRSELPKGPVTRGQIYSIYPFDNTLCLIELKGNDIKSLLKSIATYGGEPISGGVKMTVQKGQVIDMTIGEEAVEDNRIYKVATINYLIDATTYLKGLSNYISRRESGAYLYELFSDYVKNLGDNGIPVTSQIDERHIVIE